MGPGLGEPAAHPHQEFPGVPCVSQVSHHMWVSAVLFNRPLSRWRHFTTVPESLQGIAFLSKLRLLIFKPHWDHPVDLFSLEVLLEVPGELELLCFPKLHAHMHMNKRKFERNSSLAYYQMTCIGKKRHTS